MGPQPWVAYSQRREEPIRAGLALGPLQKAWGEGRNVLDESWRARLVRQTPQAQ